MASITGFMVVRILRLLLHVYGGNEFAASITCFTVVRIVRLLLQVYGSNDIAAFITGNYI